MLDLGISQLNKSNHSKFIKEFQFFINLLAKFVDDWSFL